MLSNIVILALALAAAPETTKSDQPKSSAKAGSGAVAEADRVICKRSQATGSLITRARVCKTAREWGLQSQATKDEWGGAGKPGASSGN